MKEMPKVELIKPANIERPLHRVLINWSNKSQEIVENVTYVSYSNRGGSSFLGDGPAFMHLHGISGTPFEIIKMDDKIERVQIVPTGNSVSL